MSAITTTSELTAALRPVQGFNKALPTLSAGVWASLWASAGTPGAGATTGGGSAGGATPGALPLPALTAGQDVYLAALQVAAPLAMTLMLADRLGHTFNASGTLTTAQTIGLSSPARYADSVGNQIALEVYAALGATATTATVSYTNQAGVAGRAGTVAVPANAPAGRVLFVALQAGDSGAQSVQSVTLAASTGTAGNFGITLLRPVATVGLAVPNVAAGGDFAALGLPDVGTATDTACLWLLVLPTGSGAGSVVGTYVPAVR